MCKKIVFAPHDDGGGAFGVLCRLARALVKVAGNNYNLHLYFLNSSQAKKGQERLNKLVDNTTHKAFFVPTDNLIWLPKDEKTAALDGKQIPDILKKWVRPLWHSWPCEPNWIHPNLPIRTRKNWLDSQKNTEETWKEKMTGWGNLRDLTPQWWKDVALGISMGVPQLHRVARQNDFPSVEVGDWFFSVGLRGCMQESFVSPEIIATTEPDLRMIEEDEFKAREVWLTLHQAPRRAYEAHVANSPVKFNEMEGSLWTGGELPDDPIEEWALAKDLARKIRQEIKARRNSKKQPKHVAYIMTGDTGVWGDIINKLKKRPKQKDGVAIIQLTKDKETDKIELLEGGVKKNDKIECEKLETGDILKGIPAEERRLATAGASDFGIVRSAGGALCFAATRKPSVFVDEPGHWLGRIQREQCHEAGLCVVVPIDKFLDKPARVIQKQAKKLNKKDSDLKQTVKAAKKLKVGAETDLAEYLFKTYIK